MDVALWKLLCMASLLTVVELYPASIADKQLLDDLFKNYTSELLPNAEFQILMEITVNIEHLIEVNEKEQHMVSGLFMIMTWTDEFLKWSEKKYGATSISVKPEIIWRPDIVIYNTVESDDSNSNLDQSKNRVIIENDGKVTWMVRKILKTGCSIDVTNFPFDTQVCHIKMGSWTNDKATFGISSDSVFEKAVSYTKNNQWNQKNLSTVVSAEQGFAIVTFSVTIERKSLFYVVNLIIPTALLGFIMLLTFILPAESGERMGLSVTLLLAMAVFMLLITDMIPKTSEHIPLVGIFFGAMFLEMAFIIFALCYTMGCYNRETYDPPMSKWTRRIVLDSLSYMLCVRSRGGKTEDKDVLYVENDDIQMGGGGMKSSLLVQPDNAITNVSNIGQEDISLIARKLDVILKKMKESDDDDEIKYEWRIVALTLDRFFFICSTLVLILIIICCFATGPGYVS